MKVIHIILFYLATATFCAVLTFFELSAPAAVPLYMFIGFMGMFGISKQLETDLIVRLEKVAPNVIENYYISPVRRSLGTVPKVRLFFNSKLKKVNDKEVKAIVLRSRVCLLFILITFLTIIPLALLWIHN